MGDSGRHIQLVCAVYYMQDMMGWAASDARLQVAEGAHAAAWPKAVVVKTLQHCLCQLACKEDTHGQGYRPRQVTGQHRNSNL